MPDTSLSDEQLDALLSVWFDAARPVLEDDDEAYYRGLMRDVLAKYEELTAPLLCGVENESHRDTICDLNAGHDGQHHNWEQGLAYWTTPVQTHGLRIAQERAAALAAGGEHFTHIHHSFLGSAGL